MTKYKYFSVWYNNIGEYRYYRLRKDRLYYLGIDNKWQISVFPDVYTVNPGAPVKEITEAELALIL